MFDVKKFGAAISRKRKEMDISQAHLAEMLGFTRQTISNYECGNAFPDIETITKIAQIFDMTIDELVSNSGATKAESKLLLERNNFNEEIKITEVMNVAPYLRPTSMNKIAEILALQGIDISNVLELAEFISDDKVYDLLEKANFEKVDDVILGKLIPFLTEDVKYVILDKIMEHEINPQLLVKLIGTDYIFYELIENAVVCGVLDDWILDSLRLVRNV
ncbi:MAG: helix-turn-helix transcriptional regulator [Candidatus Izemoplasmatales bacterium]|nr:helix-turn-helix transcriptional regulator [Candidatus Izemoplasmatales bacterium]